MLAGRMSIRRLETRTAVAPDLPLGLGAQLFRGLADLAARLRVRLAGAGPATTPVDGHPPASTTWRAAYTA